MEHTIRDYLQGRTGDSVPSSPCQKEQNQKSESDTIPEITKLCQCEVITNFYNYMWDSFWDHALEITVTFTDCILNKYNPMYLHRELWRLIDKNNLNFRVIMFRDYSAVGRLHFHGLIKPVGKGLEKLGEFKRQLTKRFGRTEINTINSREFYLLYMLKIYIEKLSLTPNHVITNSTRVPDLFKELFETEEPYTWSSITEMYTKQRSKIYTEK